ncbi:MAG TPA: LamG domain-containing protein [Kofleriaceae bacterium]
MTIALWMQTTNTNSSMSLIAKPWMSTYDTWQIGIDPSRVVRFDTFDGVTPKSITTATGAFPTATWTHIAVTYDATGAKLFVNGAFVKSGGPYNVSVNMTPIYIGCDLDSTAQTRYFTGLLDDVRVYRRALTDAEVAGLLTP